MKYLLTLFAAVISFMGIMAQDEGTVQAKMIVNGYFFMDDIELPENASPTISMVNDGQKNRMLAYTYDMTLPDEIIKQAIPVEKVFHGKLFLEKYQEQTEMMRGTTQKSELSKPVVGEPFPQFCETDIDGKNWSNGDIKGKVMVLNLWYSGCGPCRKGMLDQRTLVEQYKDAPVRFLYICNEKDSPREPSEKFLSDNHILGEHIFLSSDEWNLLTNKFQFNAIPFTLLLDRNGNVVEKNVPPTAAKLDELLK